MIITEQMLAAGAEALIAAPEGSSYVDLAHACLVAALAVPASARVEGQAAAPNQGREALDLKPYTYGYLYHNCIRFNGGEEVNGERPSASIPLYTQKTIDDLLALTPAVAPDAGAGEVTDALRSCVDVLGEAHSCYISGSQYDEEWDKRRDYALDKAKAALALRPERSGGRA